MAQVNSGMQLQRSSISFRRQGSSGPVWDDRFLSSELTRPKSVVEPCFLSGELARPNSKDEGLTRRSRSAHHSIGLGKGKSRSPTSESRHQEDERPLSPRKSGCGCCGGLGR